MNKMEINDDFSFTRKLIEDTGVATVPGSSFYSTPEKGRTQVRFCFCKKWDTLYAVEKALNKFKITKGTETDKLYFVTYTR